MRPKQNANLISDTCGRTSVICISYTRKSIYFKLVRQVSVARFCLDLWFRPSCNPKDDIIASKSLINCRPLYHRWNLTILNSLKVCFRSKYRILPSLLSNHNDKTKYSHKTKIKIWLSCRCWSFPVTLINHSIPPSTLDSLPRHKLGFLISFWLRLQY